MNNVSCEIILDLLPLYSDGVCSEESGNLIRAHVQTCEKCRKALRAMNLPLRGQEERETVETAQAASRAGKIDGQGQAGEAGQLELSDPGGGYHSGVLRRGASGGGRGLYVHQQRHPIHLSGGGPYSPGLVLYSGCL